MKLLFMLTESQVKALKLSNDEKLVYCVPADLAYDMEKEKVDLSKQPVSSVADRYEKNVYFAVSNKRLMVLAGEQVTFQKELRSCEKVRCEHQVGCGIITVTLAGEEDICIARVSMRQIVRASYAVRGAQAIVRSLKENGNAEDAEQITSSEYETYCEKCGRALPGTSSCPYCEGKMVVAKKFMNLCGGFVGKLLLISLSMLVISGMNMARPMVQRWFIDEALSTGKGTWADLGLFVGISFAFLIGAILLEVWKNLACIKLGSALSMSLR